MNKKAFLKALSLILCALFICGIFTACGKTEQTSSQAQSSETSSALSSDVSVSSGSGGGGGAKPVISTAFAHYDGVNPIIQWTSIEGRKGWSAKVVLKDTSGKTVFEEDGIKTNSYTLKKALTHGKEYLLQVYFTSAAGTTGIMGGIYGDGIRVIYNKPQGKYYFDGGISLDTLNNYLNRAMAYLGLEWEPEMYDVIKESIIGTGVKYVQRAACAWHPQAWDEKGGNVAGVLKKLHAIDPEIIFEACIFECITKSGVESIEIPERVFSAFGLPYEKRKFDFEKMVFPDGYGLGQWGENSGVPDITQLETQMFFYHRALFYIDSGFEALHLGQAKMIGRNDTNNECWAKVMGMIREYAAKNARRHYVLLDAHYPQFFDKNGNILVDFSSFPSRMKVADGQKDHAPSEKAPQECVIAPGHADSIYKLNIRGNSPAGWYTNRFPYLVEIDNYGINKSKLNKASADIWGYDEITWFAIQPQWYRQKFTEYLIKEIDSFNENGHMSVVGKRWITVVPGGNGSGCYYAAKKDGHVDYYDDLTFIKDLWKRLNK